MMKRYSRILGSAVLALIVLCTNAIAEVCEVDRIVTPYYNSAPIAIQDLDGTNSSSVNSLATSGSFMVEVDPIAGRRYFTSYYDQIILASDLDGSNQTQLYTGNRPYDFGLDIPNQKMYWFEWNVSGNIMCANMSGLGTPQSVISNLYVPTGLAVDDVNGFVYWLETFSNPQVIRRGTISPNCGALTNVQTIYSGTIQNSRNLSLSHDKQWLYFSNQQNGAVGRVNVNGSNFSNTFINYNGTARVVRYNAKSDRIYWLLSTGQLQSKAADNSGTIRNEFVAPSGNGNSWGFAFCESGPQLQDFTSSTANGSYGPGSTIVIEANYDSTLAVGSTMSITLNNGRQVTLNQISGTVLSASYTVGALNSGEDVADLSVSSIDSQNTINSLGFTQLSTTLPSGGNNLGDNSNIQIDVTRPTLAEISAIANPTTDTNPTYVFSSSEAGSLSLAGDCMSVSNAATSGNNSIVFDSNGAGANLALGTYSNCSILVTDQAGNSSLALNVSTFEVISFGPGAQGQGLVLWLRADEGTSTTTDGTGIQTWLDQTNFSNDAEQGNATRRPTFEDQTADRVNFNPTIRYDGANQSFTMDNSDQINTTAEYQKAFNMAFTTSSDVGSRQYLFEEGGGSRGLNLYIFNSRIYWSAWNRPGNDGVADDWDWQGFSTPISPNTEYVATFVLNGNNTTTGTIDCYLNGQLMGQATGIGRLYGHSGGIEIGAKDGSRDESGNNGGNGAYFDGEISEMIYYNDAILTTAERNRVESYLAIKYGITLNQDTAQNYTNGFGTTIFNATLTAASGGHDEYDNDIAGIGVDSNSSLNQTSSKSVNPDSILTVSTPSSMSSGEFLLWGNNDANLSTWTSTNVPPGFSRIAREWKFDETGDVGTTTITIDSSTLPSLSTPTNSYYLLLDADGDFTSGASSFLLSPVGLNTLQRTSLDPNGDSYFTIAELDATPPSLLSFTSSTADGTYGPGSNILISANYSEALAPGSTITVVLDNGESLTLASVSGFSVSGSYTVGATGSGQDSSDLTVSSITVEAVSDSFANVRTNSGLPAPANNIAATSNIIIDVTAASLAEVTAVPTITTDQTPNYTFSSSEAGTISVSGDCDSAASASSAGNNTITLDSNGSGGNLSDGIYSNCVLSHQDSVGNISANLSISTFEIAASIPSVSLSSSPASIAEASGVAIFTATLSNKYGATVTVNLSGSGTASPSDYSLSSTQISIPAGGTSGSVSVTATQDSTDENNESVILQLSTLGNATAGSPNSAQTLIIDDDAPPTVSLGGTATIAEVGGTANVTATIAAISGKTVTVNLGATGSAGIGLDYNLSSTQIVIAAGNTSGFVTLSAIDDPDYEVDEIATLSITSALNASPTAPLSADVTITSEDVGCNIDPWEAPTGQDAMIVMDAYSPIFDPTDTGFNPPTGADFDSIIMGRNAAAVANRKMLADTFFDTEYGVDFSGGLISASGEFILLHVMIDPRYEYSLSAASDYRVDSVGGDVYIGTYIMVPNIMNATVNSQGYALAYGNYGGGSGQIIPIGGAVLYGEILAVTPTDCTDGSNQSESFYLSFQSQHPVFFDSRDNIIYYDDVVSGNYGVGESHAKREFQYLNVAKTQARAKVTQIVSFPTP